MVVVVLGWWRLGLVLMGVVNGDMAVLGGVWGGCRGYCCW